MICGPPVVLEVCPCGPSKKERRKNKIQISSSSRFGFTTLLTCQVNVALYSVHEKFDKFCSESLISALDSFTLRHGTHDFASLPKEVILRIFTLWKNQSTPAGFEPANLGSSGEYGNDGTTGVENFCVKKDIYGSFDCYLTQGFLIVGFDQ